MLLGEPLELWGQRVRYVLPLAILAIAAAIGDLLLERTASEWPQLTLLIIAFVLLIVIAFMQLNTPTITYYNVYGRQGRSVLFEEAKKIIAGAKREILVLNWSAEEELDDEVRTSRADYYKKLKQCSNNLVYTRVIQSDSFWRTDATDILPIADSFDKSYVDHFREMLAEQSRQQTCGRYTTKLLVVPPRIPSTFLIADDHHLIWQLNQTCDPAAGEPHRWQIRGAIVIHDPVGTVIKQFKHEFERAQSVHRPLDADDLLSAETAEH